MASLNTFCSQEIEKLRCLSPGRIATQYQVGKLFSNAYVCGATPVNAINCFKETGIFQVDRYVFNNVDFVPAKTANQANTFLTNEPVTYDKPVPSNDPAYGSRLKSLATGQLHSKSEMPTTSCSVHASQEAAMEIINISDVTDEQVRSSSSFCVCSPE